jgi:hypothetical protein
MRKGLERAYDILELVVPIRISFIDYSNKENTKAWVPGRSDEVITSKVSHYGISVSQMTTYMF